MRTHKVQSSHVKGIGYIGQTLIVQFQDGSSYAYHKVPRPIFLAFLKSDSKGSYLAAEIKGRFDYERL